MRNVMPKQSEVLIVGGGWAGLACALFLAQKNIKTQLIEAGPTLGGRARAVSFADMLVDNGQHLCVGAYATLLELLAFLGVPATQVFLRTPLTFENLSPKKNIQLKANRFKAPWHIVYAMLNAKGIPWKEKIALLIFANKIKKTHYRFITDISVKAWLTEEKQSDFAIKYFWEPMCVALLSTPLEQASSEILLHTLRELFTLHTNYSDFLYPTENLSDLFPNRAKAYLLNNSPNSIKTRIRAKELIIENNQVKGILTHDAKKFLAKHVILATPFDVTHQLMSSHVPLFPYLRYQPITTAYLTFEKACKLNKPMIALSDTTTQWVFDRAFAHQPNVLACVISGEGQHQSLTNQALLALIKKEMAHTFSHLKWPIKEKIIRDKKAAFSASVNINKIRPLVKQSIEGLWLIGDYTNTGLPACLEGALRSAKTCAEQLKDTFKAYSD